MPKLQREGLEEFKEFLKQYNQCWYKRDIAALRQMYASDGEVTFYDNDPGCESFDLAIRHVYNSFDPNEAADDT
ncbi:MAG: hypothetical protein ACLFR1_01470 [Spirochaetia bacterium]